MHHTTSQVINPLRDASELQHVRIVAEQARVRAVQEEDSLADNLAGLIVELLGRGAENSLEDGNQRRRQLLNRGLVALICKLLVRYPSGRKRKHIQSLRIHS